MQLPDLSQQARPAISAGQSVAQYQPEDFRAAAAPGHALSELGGQIGQLAAQAADRIDTLQAEDRYTQLRNWQIDNSSGPNGFLNLKGAASVNGPQLADISDSFNGAVGQIGDGLNARALEKFKLRADIAGSQFREEFVRHQVQQTGIWAKDVTDSSIQSELRNIGANYNNDNAIGGSLARIDGLIEAYGNDPHVGMPRGEIDAMKLKAGQQAQVARWQSWASSDPVGAYENFRAHEAAISDPAERLTLNNQLKQMALPVAAKHDADLAIQGVTVPDVNTLLTVAGAPLQEAVKRQESGGQRYGPDGKLLTSAKGAQGEMQVMPATAKNPGFGVMPAQNDSPEELARVGGDYLRALLAKYDGNTTLALAAYNAGPGAVDGWTAQFGNPNQGQISNTDFAAKIPYAETRQYVSAVSGKLGAAPSNKAGTLGQLGSMLTNAEKLAETRYPDDPIYRDLVVSQVKSYVSNITAAQAGVAKQAHDALMGVLVGGAGQKPTSLPELLAVPGAQQAWGSTDAESQRGLLAVLEHNAKTARGEFVHSDPQVVRQLFDAIHLPETDPHKIRSADQLAPYFARGLSSTDYDRLRSELDKAQTPEGNVFLKDVQRTRSAAQAMLTGSMVGKIQPEVAEEASYRFSYDLDQKIAALRAAGKDPRTLFVPGTPDYVLEPSKVASYMPTGAAIVSRQAAAAPTAAAVPAKAAAPAAPAAQQYEIGKTYGFKQGQLTFLGGDPAQAASWKKLP